MFFEAASLVTGWYDSRKARSEKKKTISNLRGYVAGAQRMYGDAARNIDTKYKELGSQYQEGFQQENLLAAVANRDKELALKAQIGSTNMASIGGDKLNRLAMDYGVETDVRKLGQRTKAFQLQQTAAEEFRDVESGLLGLRQMAAQSGFRIRGDESGFNLQNYLDRGYIT